MKTFTIKQGVDLPLKGLPQQQIRQGAAVRHVALVGDDYLGLKPTMLVKEGEQVKLGQPVFVDKKNPGFQFTAPGSGTVKAIHRGAKRKFESLVISLEGEEAVSFAQATEVPVEQQEAEVIRGLLQESGLWPALRTRPFGRIPAAESVPSSLFITAMDTNPLAADPAIIIAADKACFELGLRVLQKMLEVPLHLCVSPNATDVAATDVAGVTTWAFDGPHPAGLPSTHIHFIDPVHAQKQVWHIDCQDVIRIGYLFTHGCLSTNTVVAFSGEGFTAPALVQTHLGASLDEICSDERVAADGYRLLSGGVLDGRAVGEFTGYLGRYHRQVSTLREGSGRSLFGWLSPGKDRFTATGLFLSAFAKQKSRFSFLTAVWGGHRAIYPLSVYEKVMPLDIIPLPLLKSLAVGDAEKAAELGCLELVEEDLALCSFVCPGKNEFGPMLRAVLGTLEQEG